MSSSVALGNPAFCPRSVFVRFMCSSFLTAVISLQNIKWLLLLTDKHYVLCDVRTEILNTSVIKVTFHRAKILRLLLQAFYGHRNDWYIN